MVRIVDGKHIKVREYNKFFSHATEMLLHHYDTEEHRGTVFLLGEYIWHPARYFRALHPGSRIVAYQLEQLCGGPNWHSVSRTISHLQGLDEVWDYDALNVTYLAWHGVQVHRVVPVRHVPALRHIPAREAAYDVLFYGFVNARRQRFLEKMQTRFYDRLKFLHVYGLFGPELDDFISRSKIVLNLHAFEPYHRQEQVRIFYPLINGRCVLSEKSQLNYFGDGILEFTEEDLATRIEEALDRWREVGEAGAEQFERQTSEARAYEEHVAAYRARGARA